MLDALWITLPVAVVLGFLTGLGIGGGSLLILWLTVVLGMEQEAARGINLLFFLPAAAVSCFFRRKQGRLNLHASLLATLSGCAAAVVLSLLSPSWDTAVLRKLFGVLLIAVGLRELLYRKK